MSLIDVQNLTFAYEGRYAPVFDNVSFRIDTDWKLGFVGRNGRGKTTFFNLLMGKYEYKGKITSNVKFTYFPFTVRDKDRLAYEIVCEICPEAEDWQIIRELSYLDMPADVLYRSFSCLSYGERTKLMLAGLFLCDGNFLLIDEPTDCLDAEARGIVAEYLRGKKGFILVSHDRAFLDGCVDHILSINRTDIEVRSGNFSSWYTEFEQRQEFELAENERLKKDISRLEESSRRTSDWANKTERSKNERTSAGLRPDKGFVGHKAAKLMKRAKTVESHMQRAIEQKSALLKNIETSERLKLGPLAFRAERLVSFTDFQIIYGDRKIFSPVNFEI